MKALDMIALALLIIGGLNWLLVGLFEFDLVASLFGGQTEMLSKVVYILVGLAALYSLKFFGHINEHYEDPRRPGTGTGAGPGSTTRDDRTTGTNTTRAEDTTTTGTAGAMGTTDTTDRRDTVDPTEPADPVDKTGPGRNDTTDRR